MPNIGIQIEFIIYRSSKVCIIFWLLLDDRQGITKAKRAPEV